MKNIIKPLLLSAVIATAANAKAESPSELLEQAIYLEETVGDLQSALSIYKKLSTNDSEHRKVIAEALYRQAATFNTLGNAEQAEASIERLLKQYGDVLPFAKKGNALLSALGESSLSFTDIPWANGETLTYTISGPAGGGLGKESFRALTQSMEGKSHWVFKHAASFMMNNMFSASHTVIDPQSFALIKGESDNTLSGLHHYEAHSQEVVVTKDNKTTRLPITEHVYEYNQIPYVLRRLALKAGQNYRLPVYMSNTMTVGMASITVAEKTKVTVPAGTYDVWPVAVAFNQGARDERVVHYSIADDAKRTFVGAEGTGMRMALESDLVTNGVKRTLLVVEEANVHFEVTETAQVSDIKQFDPGMKAFYMIRDFDSLSTDMFAVKSAPKETLKKTPVKKIVEGDVGLISSYFKGYTLRDSQTKEMNVDSMSAYFYVADFIHEGDPLVESRIYIKGEDHIYWFILRCKKQDYERAAKEFEKKFMSFERI